MKRLLLVFAVFSVGLGCRQTVYPSFTFSQVVRNDGFENIVLSLFGKEGREGNYFLRTRISINAGSAWDTTFHIDGNLFPPFGYRSFRDSVSVSTDSGQYIASFVNTPVMPDSEQYCMSGNMLCVESYIETTMRNKKHYLFVYK